LSGGDLNRLALVNGVAADSSGLSDNFRRTHAKSAVSFRDGPLCGVYAHLRGGNPRQPPSVDWTITKNHKTPDRSLFCRAYAQDGNLINREITQLPTVRYS